MKFIENEISFDTDLVSSWCDVNINHHSLIINWAGKMPLHALGYHDLKQTTNDVNTHGDDTWNISLNEALL